MPHTGSTALAGPGVPLGAAVAARAGRPRRRPGAGAARRALDRSPTSWARIDSAISPGVRAPSCSPAGVKTRAAGRRRRRGTPARRRRASRWPRGQRRGPRRAGPPPARLPPPCRARRRSVPRRRPRGSADSPSVSSTSRPTPEPSVARACATGVVPTTRTRGAGIRGWRKISIAPPLRHGLETSTAPSSAVRDGSPGSTRSRRGSWEARTCRLYSRTEASTQFPPTKPWISPLGSTRAVSPAWALVGCWARTTVAWTNGSRRPASSSALAARDLCGGGHSDRRPRPALHGGPDPGRGAGHVHVRDAVRRQGVDDGVDDRRR